MKSAGTLWIRVCVGAVLVVTVLLPVPPRLAVAAPETTGAIEPPTDVLFQTGDDGDHDDDDGDPPECPPGVACGEPVDDDDDGGDESEPEGLSGAIQRVFHILKFPYETFKKATIMVTLSIINDAFDQAEYVYGRAVEGLIYGPHGIAPYEIGTRTTPLFEDLVLPHWRITFALALALLPATLALTAVHVMRTGVASVLSYAELKESLLHWVIAAGAAAASFYLLGLAHRVSLAASRAILLSDFAGAPVNARTIANAFLNGAAFAAVNWLFPSIALYVGFFLLFLGTAVIFGLALALASYIALVYILAVLAPLVIVVGALPPLRWLHFLWMKAVTVTFLIPLANALILRAAIAASTHFLGGNLVQDPTPFISGFFVTAGMISLLIAINYKVGEFVFGAIGEVHRRALDSTRQVLGMVMVAAGAVAGGLGAAVGASGPATGGGGAAATGGAVGGSGGGFGGGSGAAAAVESAAQRSATPTDLASTRASSHGGYSSSPSERLAGDPHMRNRIGQLVARGGHALAMGTRNPLLRGFGLGAQVGGEYAAGQARIEVAQAQQATAARRETDRGYDRSLDRAQRSGLSGPLASPPELARPGYDPQGLLGRHLQRSVPEAAPDAAARLNARVNEALRGSQAGEDPDALVAARADLYTAYGAGHTSAGYFANHLAGWAATHNVSLPAGWRDDVEAMYPPTAGGMPSRGEMPDLSARIRGHMSRSQDDQLA